MQKDFLELLQLLNEHKVRYLIIGGYAFSFHVEPRYTKDLDIWVQCSTNNASNLIEALDQFGAPIANLSLQDFAKPGLLYIFGIPPLRVDILTKIKKQNFDKCFARKAIFKANGITFPVVSRLDLVSMKKIAGRPQDLSDLDKLVKSNKLTSKKPNKPLKLQKRKKSS